MILFNMNFIKHIFQMSNVQRFSGKTLHNPHSIGEHSYRVSVLAMGICDHYNQNNKSKISMEEVLKKALLHDLEETVTGDMPSPVKAYGNLRKEMRNAGSKILSLIVDDSPNPKEYVKLWKEDKEDESGEIIEVADKLEGLLTCFFEIKSGNYYLRKSLISHLEWFESKKGQDLLHKYAYAKKVYDDAKWNLKNQKEKDRDFFEYINDL